MMNPILSGFCLASIAFALSAQEDSSATPAATNSVYANQHGLPGSVAGTERWIVHFQERPFDLSAFRTAIYARRPAHEVNQIVRDLETAAEAHQRAFVREVQKIGGQLHAQWWLINACAIDIPHPLLAQIAALPNVKRLEADAMTMPTIGVATNSSNHNSDYVQTTLKIIGTGVTTAIVDTGVDVDMAGKGRPHRTYFINGDLTNTSGTGIGGTRLVVAKKIGALIVDDQHGHGTAVSSIAAGANWGTTAADHGHAFGANVAGYSIANQVSGGGSSSSTMASAWQQVAADRAQHNIVSGNLSYSGSPSTTNSAQIALDSAAFNADVMIAVAAGNSGTASSATTGSQGAANGIAVGAIKATAHTMASFSSRGPLPSGRLYPDIAACGVSTVMAKRNNEGGNSTGSGTSMASPMVCGAATLMRSANPQLTALETKAILLAAAQDISNENASWDRNSYGMGMMRADRATEIALGNTGSFSTASLPAGTTTWTKAFPLSAGKSYAFATTWHRDPNIGSTWSNLDLELLDAQNKVVATSDTPLNLYEMFRPLIRTAGTYTLRVTAKSMQPGITTQDFSVAMVEVPTAAVVGRANLYGIGCKGSGLLPNRCISLNGNGGQLSGITRNATYAYQATTNVAITVTGFELYTQTTGAISRSATASLYLSSGSVPAATPIATGTMTVGSLPGFYQVKFSTPVNIQAGASFFLGLALKNRVMISSITGGYPGIGYYLNAGTWIRSSLTSRPSFHVNCQGTGIPGAVPRLTLSGTPKIAATVTVKLSRAAASSATALIFGLSDTSYGNLQLPLSLTSLGAPGCSLLASGEITRTINTNSLGAANVRVVFPNDKNLVGLTIFNQFATIDGSANSLGLAMSNGSRMLVGGQP